MMGTYTECTGDVTQPRAAKDNRPIIIPHVCNNVGAFGAGVALSIAMEWPHVQRQFREFSQRFSGTKRDHLMGMVQFVAVKWEDGCRVFVANMFAQNGLRSAQNLKPLSYPDLTRAMADVVHTCNTHFGQGAFEIHCPKFGTALAGGNWKKIRPIIDALWINSGIDVTVYNFGG